MSLSRHEHARPPHHTRLWRPRRDEDDDPVRLRADGSPVDTWREGYPYGERLAREIYERDRRLLQIDCSSRSTGRSGRSGVW
jgi:hypothetical protein